jgi:hypothetical protein
VLCIVCNRRESLVHRFWDCPYAAHCWETLRLLTGFDFRPPPSGLGNHRNLQTWLLDWMGKVQGKELALGLMLWAQMWYARNEARGNPSIEDPVCTARRAVYLVEEWEGTKNTTQPPSVPQVAAWCPPPNGWLQANVDGAKPLVCGGGAVVLRDHHASL